MSCPFCSLPDDRIIATAQRAVAIRDAFPVSPGHSLVIPIRHVGSIFDATADELRDLWRLVAEVRDELRRQQAPDGFNIGINDGGAAGQTVPHLHVHVIPRYAGDRPDPRGGIRWIIPDKADYWTDRDG